MGEKNSRFFQLSGPCNWVARMRSNVSSFNSTATTGQSSKDSPSSAAFRCAVYLKERGVLVYDSSFGPFLLDRASNSSRRGFFVLVWLESSKHDQT